MVVCETKICFAFVDLSNFARIDFDILPKSNWIIDTDKQGNDFIYHELQTSSARRTGKVKFFCLNWLRQMLCAHVQFNNVSIQCTKSLKYSEYLKGIDPLISKCCTISTRSLSIRPKFRYIYQNFRWLPLINEAVSSTSK